jgi:hypothetical protein
VLLGLPLRVTDGLNLLPWLGKLDSVLPESVANCPAGPLHPTPITCR